MNRQQAIELVKQTFESVFNREHYIRFLRQLLNKFNESARVNQGARIPEKFQDYVEKIERVGKYVTGKNEVMLFIVHLKRETSIERARAMQRNFVAWYLQRDMKDAALAAFVSPNAEDWRFSLVKMEYRIEEGAKVREEFTPARRWSFLVGVNERSHTAQSRFVPLLENDETPPTLAQLEEAFNIERVTKEFFEKYRDLFVRTKEALDQAVAANPAARSDFEAKGVDTVNLAKKLLGQIVFLYYLQKKGWFGVPRDAAWGAGSKRFLRELFEKRHGEYRNFFNDILEPLFYEALRIDRSHDDHYYSRFNCKIPFLNGGLFDPLNGYDWVHADLLLPNALFSNTNRTREGDTGDGILDVFDRYNFTVKEDEPFEKEVAIDPELLGKAYEKFNAIRPDNYEAYLQALRSGKKGEESKFNKQYGVYYTPREIVHYMCQQSLIQYLYAEVSGDGKNDNALVEYSEAELANLGLPTRADIETLILRGEQIREHDEQVMAAGRETETYSFLMPEAIRNNAARLDRALADIKVCDPAAGSGAFPVGMMNEVVKARLVLSIYLPSPGGRGAGGEGASAYAFKRACIENALYGVDIDPGAVEIAKLRLWLSLVVDEDDANNIKPLPNLDYKIVCGNSLLGVEKDLFNHALFAELERLKPLYFNETQPARKQQLKAQIDRLIDQLTNGRAQFDFEIYFSEVFHHKGGFDVVIGNPPYLESRHPDFSDDFKELYQAATKKRWGEDAKFVTRGSDLLIYFFENAIFNLNQQGCVVLITQNSWLDTEYGKKFQNFLLKKTQVRLIVDSDFRYFSSGDGPNINAVITLFFGKTSHPSNKITFARYHENFERTSNLSNPEGSPSVDVSKYAYTDSLLQDMKWGFLLAASKEILEIFDLLRQRARKLEDIKEYRLVFGQGLNLSKGYLVNSRTLETFPFAKKAAISLLTSEDGATFVVQKTSHFILDKTKLSKDEIEQIKAQGIIPFDSNATSKKTPKLIMPRGISKHFCAYNSLGCYSSSGVDLYDVTNTASEKILLNLWLFLNSSLFWLLREISGRKNLGGGMLKSEAVDLENMPVYMDFQNTEEIKKLLEKLSKRQALNTINEIETNEHKRIDEIVFDYLRLKESQRQNVISTLKQKIADRERKATT